MGRGSVTSTAAAAAAAAPTGQLAVQWVGGLGNRLFQYHAALHFARRWRKEYVVDMGICRDADHGSPEWLPSFFVDDHPCAD